MSITWMDNLSGLGIMLIMMWHSFFPEGSLLVQYLFSFHVMLFFFMSWLLFNEKKHNNFFVFMKAKFNSLIIPFVFFNSIMFAFYTYKSMFMDFDYYVWTEAFMKWMMLWSYLPDNPDVMLANMPTWFLVSLFVVCIYYYFINKYMQSKNYRLLFLLLLSMSMYFESKYMNYSFPFNLEMSLFSVLFYWLGHMYKDYMLSAVNKINIKYMFLTPFFMFVNMYFLTGINLSTNYYWDNYLMLLLNGFLGVTTFIIFAKLMPKNSILDFLWKNSIMVLWMERIKFIVLSMMMKLSFWLLVFEASYMNAFIQMFWTVLALIPIIFIMNSYFPFIIWITKKGKYK